MDATVEEIKNRLHIEEVIGGYIPMQRAGTNFKALCPFHNEKTPSMMISPDKGIWHCFGCDAGGDIFGFVMRMEGVEFPEALRLLADKAGVKLERRDPRVNSRRNRLLDLLSDTTQFFQEQLRSEAGKIARDYIAQRKMSDLTVDQFGIGYAPSEWEALITALRSKGYKEEEMVAAGVILKRQPPKSGYFDRFRNRLIFPLRNVNGYVVGFTARVLDPKDTTAKYINTPETEIYHKGEVVFGLDAAKTEIRRRGYAIMVEGQMDCISSHQAGVTNVVATSGTALTPKQLDLLKRYCTNLVLAFDMDKAGQEAIKRGIDLAVAQGFNLRVATATAGKDPDELIQQDVALWRSAIKESTSIHQFYFDNALKGLDLSKPEHKKRAAQLLLPRIARITDVVEQTHYLQRLAALVGTSEEVLRGALPLPGATKQVRGSQVVATKPSNRVGSNGDALREQRLIALALSFPRHIDAVLDRVLPEYLTSPETQELYKLLANQYNNEDEFTARAFITAVEQAQPQLSQALKHWLLVIEKERDEVDVSTLEREISFNIFKLQQRYYQRQMQEIQQRIRQAEALHDQSALDGAAADFNHYVKALAALEQKQEL